MTEVQNHISHGSAASMTIVTEVKRLKSSLMEKQRLDKLEAWLLCLVMHLLDVSQSFQLARPFQ